MILLKESGVEDKADGLTGSLKDKLEISSFIKKVSFIGACGFLNFFVFILRKMQKGSVQVKNVYIDSFTKIIKLINTNVPVFTKYISIVVVIFFLLYWLAFLIANHFSSEVFWTPYPFKEDNRLKSVWDSLLRTTIFYRKLNANGITYFTSLKYCDWYKKLQPAGKKIILFVLKLETLYFTFEYLSGMTNPKLEIIIFLTWIIMLYDCYKLMFMTSGIPNKLTLYDLVNRFITINEYDGKCYGQINKEQEKEKYLIVRYDDLSSKLYYLVFVSAMGTPSFKDKLQYLRENGVEKYKSKYNDETIIALYAAQPVICYSESYTELLTYINNSGVLCGKQKNYPIKI